MEEDVVFRALEEFFEYNVDNFENRDLQDQFGAIQRHIKDCVSYRYNRDTKKYSVYEVRNAIPISEFGKVTFK
jgi:hypothetical protein